MEAGLAIGLSISVILLFGLVMERFKLPMVLGVLLAGALMGPASPIDGIRLGPIDLSILIMHEPEVVELFALLGSVLILFSIGLEFSILKLFRMGLSTFLAALIKLGIAYIIGYAIAGFMGFGIQAAVLLGLLLSFSSTPITIKILEGHGKLRRAETPFIMAVLIIEDLVAVALLGILATGGALNDNYAIASALLKVVVIFAIAYVLLSRVIKKLLEYVEHSDEFLILFVVSMILISSYVCQAIGLGFSVGSFLAGSVMAATVQSKRIEEMIKPFNTLFASFFFFSIGMMVDSAATVQALPLLFGLLVVAALGKYIASASGAYLTGLSGSSASFAASALLPLGELSLLIGSTAAANHIIPTGLVGLLATVIIMTSIFSVFAVGNETKVYNTGKGMLPELVSKNMGTLRSTSIGVQRVVEENSRYSNIVNKLPSISHGHGAHSSHDQLSLAIRNIFITGFISFSLFLLLHLSNGPWKEQLVGWQTLFFLGFYAIAALFIVSSASALDNYAKMLYSSGKEGLKMAIHTLGSFYFLACALIIATITSFTGDANYLMLMLPVVLLGISHPLQIGVYIKRLALAKLHHM